MCSVIVVVLLEINITFILNYNLKLAWTRHIQVVGWTPVHSPWLERSPSLTSRSSISSIDDGWKMGLGGLHRLLRNLFIYDVLLSSKTKEECSMLFG